MSHAKGVIRAFVALGEPGQPTRHAQATHACTPPSENLVGIGLVPHVPHQPIFRGVVEIMQGQGQLNRAKVGRQMSAGLTDRIHQKFAQFTGQLRQLLFVQTAQIRWRFNAV